jgi:hypothetical protein
MRRRKSYKKNGVFVIQINYDTRREFENKENTFLERISKQKERKVVIVVNTQSTLNEIYL